MIKNYLFIALLLSTVLLSHSCTPKTTEVVTEVTEQPPSPEPPAVKLSPCPKFTDAPNRDEAETNYVLYRDFLKAEDYKASYDYWKKVYEVAPAADGQRNTIFSDGIFFYEHFLYETQDSSYIDSIFIMYDQIEQCYPEGGYVNGRRAFDYYYKYPNRLSKLEIYQLFKKSIDEDGLETNDFVINPFTALLTELHDSTLISDEEARQYDTKIKEIIRYGTENCKGVYCQRWEIVSEYAPQRLQYFETVKDFYDCEYYIYKYYPKFEASPDSCEVVYEVMSRLSWGGCTEGMPEYDAVKAVIDGDCKQVGGIAQQAYKCLQNGDYNCAVEKFLEAADAEDEIVRKSEILLLVAKIYYVHRRNFSRARRYALEAAEVRDNWGAPYILIGRMYASSGPLCGPGRGWDSQIVTWPAIDMWNKAKRIDPASAAEARKWINQYSQYMPTKGEVFQRGKKVGDTYFVPCWIQRSTTIRVAN